MSVDASVHAGMREGLARAQEAFIEFRKHCRTDISRQAYEDMERLGEALGVPRVLPKVADHGRE